MLCITGLPLVLREEIGDLLSDDPPYAVLPAETPKVNLDRLVVEGARRFPQEIVTSVFIDDDEPMVLVWMAPSWREYFERPSSRHFIKFDSRTGERLKETTPPDARRLTFMGLMLRLHNDLFADLAGRLLLAFMGLLFIAAIVSGVALYGPFAKKHEFGVVRMSRSPRLRWLDLHNLLGIVTVAWATVVGATGIMNELSSPLFALFQATDVRAILAPYQGQPVLPRNEFVPVQTALEAGGKALPGMKVISVVFPGARFGSPHHYLVWGKGGTPLTSKLFNPVLVDAKTGELSAVIAMPWYLRALQVSRPLHFGNYGGIALKIVWVLLDIATIVVLLSGLYLWIVRQPRRLVQ